MEKNTTIQNNPYTPLIIRNMSGDVTIEQRNTEDEVSESITIERRAIPKVISTLQEIQKEVENA